MIINTDGIILRQIKTTGGRRMLLLFTRQQGKISAGSSLSERGRSRAALALRPFTYGAYELYRGRDAYDLHFAEVKRSFFGLGENVDKYMQASFALELTEKMLPEELPQPRLFQLLLDYLGALERRERQFETLLLAYEIKALDLLGSAPQVRACARCGAQSKLSVFSVPDGGMLCEACAGRGGDGTDTNDTLIYAPKFDIVNIIKFFSQRPLAAFEKIALDPGAADSLQQILRSYLSYHLDIGRLKSEYVFEGEF